MTEIERIAKKEGVSTRTVYRWLSGAPRKKEPSPYKLSVRLSTANWERLRPLPNYSETVNRALEKYFTPEGSQRPPRQ